MTRKRSLFWKDGMKCGWSLNWWACQMHYGMQFFCKTMIITHTLFSYAILFDMPSRIVAIIAIILFQFHTTYQYKITFICFQVNRTNKPVLYTANKKKWNWRHHLKSFRNTWQCSGQQGKLHQYESVTLVIMNLLILIHWYSLLLGNIVVISYYI